jgi:hypothetical protein
MCETRISNPADLRARNHALRSLALAKCTAMKEAQLDLSQFLPNERHCFRNRLQQKLRRLDRSVRLIFPLIDFHAADNELTCGQTLFGDSAYFAGTFEIGIFKVIFMSPCQRTVRDRRAIGASR